MTWLKSATRKPLGKQTEGLMKAHDIICVHTMVGYLDSTDTMFKRNGYTGTESHFGIGGKWGSDARLGLDGVLYQWQDTNNQADANLDGKNRVISIETADNAPSLPRDIAVWTPKQSATLIDLIVDLCLLYDIPPVLIPDTRQGRRGLAYHAQGCTPNIVTGGESWSLAAGKECPGPKRIRQFKEEIIPAVYRRLRPVNNTPPVKEKDMEWTEKVKLTASDASVWNQHGGVDTFKAGSEVRYSDMVRYPTLARKIDIKLTNYGKRVDGTAVQVDHLVLKVDTLEDVVSALKEQNIELKKMLAEVLLRIPKAE